jgi:hypothetical protein
MSIVLPDGFHWDNQLKLGQETAALTSLVWPNYLVLDSDIPEPGLKFEINEQEFIRRFPVWGIRRDDNRELVAYMNAVLLAVDFASETLPNDGWRFAIQSAASKAKPNCLCLLVGNVNPAARGAGLSQILINHAKQATLESGFNTMIAPVRPILKYKFPEMPMEEYVHKKNELGEVFDPWINMHVKSGGQIVNVCSESVVVTATLAKWREWTGLPLTAPGPVLLPGGLVRLEVDVEKGVGIYREPNVWLAYGL